MKRRQRRQPVGDVIIPPAIPNTYEFYWQCRAPRCRAVHWYHATKCQRCGNQLARFENPNFDQRRKKTNDS